MATYAELSDDEKAILATEDAYLRGVMSSLMALRRQADADLRTVWAEVNVLPIMEKLDGKEVLPKNTGLAGTSDFTAEERNALRGLLRGISDLAAENIALIVKAIGVNA